MADNARAKLKRLYQGTYEFLTEKWIETHEESQVTRLQGFGQFWVLVFNGFSRNRCPVRATALAYTTLLALVPLLAVVLSITSSLLQEKGADATKQIIEQFVDAAVPQLRLLPPEPVSTNAPPQAIAIPPHRQVVNQIYEFMANIKVKTLGATGMAGLVVIAIMLLSTIEGTFNDIWGVAHGRSWTKRVIQYWAAISLGPIALALAIVLAGNTYSKWTGKDNATVTVNARADRINYPGHSLTNGARVQVQVDSGGSLPGGMVGGAPYYVINPAKDDFQLAASPAGASIDLTSAGSNVKLGAADDASALRKLVSWLFPVLYISLAFAIFYKLMPNTQVHWGAAAMGGMVGGSLWLFLNLFNTFFLTRILTFSKIYGTALALLPIFLLGLYFSWLIMLFGAQVAYAYQNRSVYVQEKKAESVGQRGREYIALRVMTLLAKRFALGELPPNVLEIATELAVPSRLVGRVLQPLMAAHLVHEVAINKEDGYAPARPIDAITCSDVLMALRGASGAELMTRQDGTRDAVCAEFQRIEDAEKQAASVSLKDLLARIGAQELKREQVTRGIVEAINS